MTGNDLTIVSLIAGRQEFNKRFFTHICKLPFRFLPDHADDRLPVKAWLARINAVVALIETPYAMLCDNDDLPTADLERCLEFLDFNLDYVCASGRIHGFHMWPDPVTGPHSAVMGLYTPFDTPADYNQPSISDRVLAGFANSWSYYGVYRTKALQQIRREVCELGLTDLQVHEKFCAMRTLTLGKAYCIPNVITLYRQHGTSEGATSYKRDNAVRGRDIAAVMSVMATSGVDGPELWTRWRRWYATRDAYLFNPRRRKLKMMFPRLAWLYQNRHRYLPHQALNVQG